MKDFWLGFLYGFSHPWRWPFGERNAQRRAEWIAEFNGDKTRG